MSSLQVPRKTCEGTVMLTVFRPTLLLVNCWSTISHLLAGPIVGQLLVKTPTLLLVNDQQCLASSIVGHFLLVDQHYLQLSQEGRT
jgi:hypothetical protein